MKRILIVAECINKNKTSEGIGTTSFLNALAQGPFEIDCVYYQFIQFELEDTSHISKKINFIKIRNNWIDAFLQSQRRLRRLYAKIFGTNLLRDRRSKRFEKYVQPILEKKQYDVVFVRTIAGSLASHNAILNLSKKINFKWVVNFNDPAPIAMMPFPYFNGKIQFPKQIEKDEVLVHDIVEACDGITSPSVLLTQLILDFTKVDKSKNKIYRFPHIFVKPKKIVTPSFLDKKKFNIVHPGSLLGPRNPEFLLNAYKKFIEDYPEKAALSRLTFFGKIHSNHKAVFEAFPYPELLDIRDLRIPHEEALGVLKESSVLIILEAISEESPFMPGKLAEFIGLNKIIWALSPTKSETRRILGPAYNYQCEANSEVEIFDQLIALYNRWEKNNQMDFVDIKLKEYISSSHVIKEMELVLKDVA